MTLSLLALVSPPGSNTNQEPVFAFENAFEEILAYAVGDEDPLFDYALTPSGAARIDSSGALRLSHGAFSAKGQGKSLVERLGDNEALTLSVAFKTEAPSALEPGLIVRFGASDRAPSGVELSIHKGQLTFKLPTASGTASTTLDANKDQSLHIFTATYDGQRLRTYLDGNLQGEGTAATGGLDLGTQDPQIGSGSFGTSGFDGTLLFFRLHPTTADDDEVLKNARADRDRLSKLKQADRLRAEVTLVAKSHVPSVQEISPYREALAVYEYRIRRVLEGSYQGERIRVAHWVILDRTSLPIGSAALQSEHTLKLERFAANRQLDTVSQSDTLPFDFDLEVFFDVSAPALPETPPTEKETSPSKKDETPRHD